MSPAAIWWEQIGSQLRMMDEMSSLLEDERSFVLHMKNRLPWRSHFYERFDTKRSKYSFDRRLKRLEWTSSMEPGAFVLRNLCPPSVQADYYPGQTYAEYLGSRDDLILCDYYVWITGIHERNGLAAWLSFIRSYEAAARALERRAVYVLEYDGAEYDISPVPAVCFEIKTQDCRVYCLQLASELNNSSCLSYQAELALNLCGDKPEMAAALLQAGEDLLAGPEESARRILSQARDSDGAPFSVPADSFISSSVWKACLVLVYPVIEQYRMDFIRRHEGELRPFLPISNSNGDVIREPSDLEIGPLYYIVSSKSRHVFPQEDAERIRLCRNVRNLLAHNKTPPCEEIVRLLALPSV